MNRLSKKISNQLLRRHRVRATIQGTVERPRLSVHVSDKHITAQVIDDVNRRTLVYVSTVGQKNMDGTMTEKASKIGTEVAKKAKLSKINRVVFDRGMRLYHGRVKALAEAARKNGLEF